MALTSAQLTTLKNDIAADPVLSLIAQTPDGAFEVAVAYNLLASPNFYVWRTDVTNAEVIGQLVWTEMQSLSTIDLQIFNIMLLNGGFDASDPNIRQGITDIFSGPQAATTRANLTALGKRLSTRAEKLFAAGTGSEASPATMVFEGNLSYQDILAAWSQP